MGKGGEQAPPMKTFAGSTAKVDRDSELIPTKKQVRDALPPEVFEHSTANALGLVLRDACVLLAFGAPAWCLLPSENIPLLAWAAWMVYGFFQGIALTGWWVLAHECGHGGFSASQRLNDCVGWVLHSLCLVPYFSWQYSHAKHHSKTNSLQDGETHNPMSKADFVEAGYDKLHHMIGDDAFAGFQLLTHLVLGWPMYLITNATGARRLYNGKPIADNTLDHFRPGSKLFPPGWSFRVFLSSLGVALVLAGLFAAGNVWGGKKIALMYIPPYLWCNHWLVLYTWLQHTKPDVPQMGDEDWTWMKGALCTIDRPYAELFGFVDWMHHHIGSTHVFHHLFSNAPCYKAVEATRHLKAYLEPKGLYNYDPRGTVEAMWDTAKDCHYVEALDGVQYFVKQPPKGGKAQ